MTIAQSINFRNYRSYGPGGATLPIVGEFLAVVGVNNSGKSTLLRSFWELRAIYQLLGQANTNTSEIQTLLTGGVPFAPRITEGERVAPTGDDSTPRVRINFETEAPTSESIDVVELILERTSVARMVLHRHDGAVLSNPTAFTTVSGGADRVLLQMEVKGVQYHLDWSPLKRPFAELADSFYVGAFRNAVNSGQAPYYDMQIGKGFIETFDSYRNGANAYQNEAANTMARDLAKIFGFKDLQISVSPNKDQLLYMVDGKSYRGTELGAGITQFVIVAANVLVRQPNFLLIDEPELNLHASLQASFLSLLAKYTKGPVIYSTHSLGLARSTADQTLVSMRNDANRSTLQPWPAVASLSLVLGELGYGGLHDTSFKAVLLVEGVTEVRSMQALLTKFGVRNEVVVLSLGGDDLAVGGRGQELAELRRLAENVFAVVDSERTEEGTDPDPRRLAFAADCKEQGIECHVLERRAFENYLDQNIAREILKQPDAPDFGHFDKPDPAWQWSKPRNWRIADAMTHADLAETDLGTFLDRLVQSLQSESSTAQDESQH